MAEQLTGEQSPGAKAPAVLDPGEQFRKIKRALLATAAVGLLYALASVGPNFEPQLLGQGVKIPSWMISSGLLIYVIYLWVGFEHERRRASAAYRELIYEKDFARNDPEAAIERLLQPVREFAAKVETLSSELMTVERTYRQFAPDYRPTPSDMPSRSFTQMKITEAIGRVAEISMSDSETKEHEYVQALETFRLEIDKVPELVVADVMGLLRPGIEANSSHKSQADQAVGRLEELQERMTAAGAELKISHTAISKLSSQLSDRERYMFTWYDTWAPNLLTIAAVVGLTADLAQHWPESPLLVEAFNLGFFLFQCWRMF